MTVSLVPGKHPASAQIMISGFCPNSINVTSQFTNCSRQKSNTIFSLFLPNLISQPQLFLPATNTSQSIKYFYKKVNLITVALSWIAEIFPYHWKLKSIFSSFKFGLVIWLTLANGTLMNTPKTESWKVLTHWSLFLIDFVTFSTPCEKVQFSLMECKGTFE